MTRLLTVLIMLALALTNGAAVATAMCQHGSLAAHAAARESLDTQVSASAIAEEENAAMASKESLIADGAGVLLAGYTLPPDQTVLPPPVVEPSAQPPMEAAAPVGRSIPPPLKPPLA